MKNISKGTIIRTILLFLVIVNIFLEKKGIDLIPADEHTITMIVETLIELAVIVVGFWKNNSYSEKAIKADQFLQYLKNSETESESVEG
jgi:SPP1 family holin